MGRSVTDYLTHESVAYVYRLACLHCRLNNQNTYSDNIIHVTFAIFWKIWNDRNVYIWIQVGPRPQLFCCWITRGTLDHPRNLAFLQIWVRRRINPQTGRVWWWWAVWQATGSRSVGGSAAMRGARRLHPADTLAEDARLVTMATHQQQQFSLSSALNSSHSHHATVCLCLTDGRSLLFAASNHLESKCNYTISCYVYTYICVYLYDTSYQ